MPSPQVPTSLRDAARGVLERLVPRGWWHAAAGSGEHVAARDAVRLPNGRIGGRLLGGSPVVLRTTTAFGSPGGLPTMSRSMQSRIGSGGQRRQVAIRGGRPLPFDNLGQRSEPVVVHAAGLEVLDWAVG